MLTVSCVAASAYLILSPAFIEDHIHDNAGKAHVILDHHLELCLILLLLCKAMTGYEGFMWKTMEDTCGSESSSETLSLTAASLQDSERSPMMPETAQNKTNIKKHIKTTSR